LKTEILSKTKEYLLKAGDYAAKNYKNHKEVGKHALEAFDLAITRGGAQVVVFDNDSRSYFGKNLTTLKSNVRMQARMMANTLINITKRRDVVYLMTHKGSVLFVGVIISVIAGGLVGIVSTRLYASV